MPALAHGSLMNYSTSSQLQRWIFTPEALAKIRETNRDKAIAVIKEVREAAEQQLQQHQQPLPDKPSEGTAPEGQSKKKGKFKVIGLEDEKKLCKYYSHKISQCCDSLQLPVKVKATAQMYLKRFYLAYSLLDHVPAVVSITCIYLAAKIEEHYISAETLARLTRQSDTAVLSTEPVLLGSLKLDLIVYHPYRSLSSFIQDLQNMRGEDEVESVAALTEKNVQSIRDKANAACDVLMNTDAPLIYSPAQLALAALRSSMKNFPNLFDWFLERLIKEAPKPTSTESSDSRDKLKEIMRQVDNFGVEGATPLDDEEVRKIDKRLKACHNPLNNPNSKEYQKRKEEEKLKQMQLKDQKRAAKAARVKSADLSFLADLSGSNNPLGPSLPGKSKFEELLAGTEDATPPEPKRQKPNP